jgi:SAM-dependent methyltransferase
MQRPHRFRRLARRTGCIAALAALCMAGPTSRAQDLDVPFVTTPDNVTLAMLELARVTRADHVIDLGSGDGRIVITAARRFGATGLGVEIVPDLVAKSRLHAERAGVASRARFEEQDLHRTDLTPATVVTMYLLPEVNLALKPKLLALAPGTRIVSHDWDLGDWAPDQTHTVPAPDKPIGRDKQSRLHLWLVPARVEGLWCATHGPALKLEQRYQQLSGSVRGQGTNGVREWSLVGRLQGADMRLVGTASGLAGRVEGNTLHVREARGAWRGLGGQKLRRAEGPRC